jgi:hypothetical protein
MEREGVDTRAREMEGPLADALAPLLDHDLVSEIRTGAGLLAAVQIDPAVVEADPGLPGRAAMACRDEGGVITPRTADLPRAHHHDRAARRDGHGSAGRTRRGVGLGAAQPCSGLSNDFER